MLNVENARFCKGCLYESIKIQEWIKARVDGGCFKGKNDDLEAMFEQPWVPNRCARTTVCPMFVASKGDIY